MTTVRLRVPALFILIAFLATNAHPGSDEAQMRLTMHRTFDAIAYLLPLGLRDESRLNEIDKELIKQHLNVLTSSGKELVKHAVGREHEFQLLTLSFDHAVEQVAASFGGERYIDAYFSLSDMTENCVSCHSRLPDSSDYLLGQKLFARMDTDMLDSDDIAQLYIATRQFDNALTEFEKIILDETANPYDLDLDGVFIDYLQIGIAVDQSFKRLETTLEKFSERQDAPLYMHQQVKIWRESMHELEGELKAEPSIERARQLFDQATGLTLTPSGRERAVHDIVAASLLRRLLDSSVGLQPVQISEAYYLLGVISLRTLRTKPAVPEMELLLESAIYAAPESGYAKAAYLLLEEFSYAHYLNFGAKEIPDPNADMRKLREIIQWQ